MTGAERLVWDEKYHGVARGEALARIRDAGRMGIIRAVVPFLRPGGRVLEAGSGTGRLVSHLALEREVRGVGLDYSWQANLGAAQSARAVGARTTFVSGDLVHLPFPSDDFDLVFSDSVIEHLADPLAAVAEMARVVRPGGHVIVTTPNRLRPDGWDLYKLRYRPQYLQRSFFPWQLGRMLAACDLTVERYFGDTLLIPRNFRLRAVRRGTASRKAGPPAPARKSWGLYWRAERAAERVLPSTMWVNIGVVARKPPAVTRAC